MEGGIRGFVLRGFWVRGGECWDRVGRRLCLRLGNGVLGWEEWVRLETRKGHGSWGRDPSMTDVVCLAYITTICTLTVQCRVDAVLLYGHQPYCCQRN